MITDFDKYNDEVLRFKNSKNYPKIYNEVISWIKSRGSYETPSKILESNCGIPGTAIRAIVSYARCEEHLPIGSNNAGYFWAKIHPELQGTIAHLEERAFKIGKAANGLRQSLPDKTQMEMGL